MKRIVLSTLLLLVLSCQKTATDKGNQVEGSVKGHVLTQEEQEKLTPDAVIADLEVGNKDFRVGCLTDQNTIERVRAAAVGQYPAAVVLSCIDSRVPVEELFHKAIGDLFVVRVAGNVVDTAVLGSLEYACKVAGAKVVVVLGHEHCGAIKSSINGVKLGNITPILNKIEPAVKQTNKTFTGEKSAKNPAYVAEVCTSNVVHAMDDIRENSPILDEMEQNQEIKIVGAIYDMEDGKITFL